MTFNFSALSSNKEDTYEVEVFEVSGQIGISCNCPANTFCKHIAALITGKTSVIFPAELNKPDDINNAVSLLVSNGMRAKYESLMAELDALKAEYKDNTIAIKHELNSLCTPKI
ncbi:hypothetical protein [Xenorhabdus vietnamensis]|uniref:hypothetical protein n=1 Tax=Xenorhabdus vietnamensis TaxID=351656 RepID=UPI000A327E5F|nr:hypothetical protein [Xenorhabdus vietnamensis]